MSSDTIYHGQRRSILSILSDPSVPLWQKLAGVLVLQVVVILFVSKLLGYL